MVRELKKKKTILVLFFNHSVLYRDIHTYTSVAAELPNRIENKTTGPLQKPKRK